MITIKIDFKNNFNLKMIRMEGKKTNKILNLIKGF